MKTLQDMGLERVSHVETGFGGWKESGMPIVSYDEWKASHND